MAQEALSAIKAAESAAEEKKNKARDAAKEIRIKSQKRADMIVEEANALAEATVSRAIDAAKKSALIKTAEYNESAESGVRNLKSKTEQKRERAINAVIKEVIM